MLTYFSLGTNLGDKEQNLRRALACMEQRLGRLVACSAFHATAPWGFASANAFLNAACVIETSLTPQELLSRTQQIERELGRTAKSVDGCYADRLIDIDILLYGDRVLDTPSLRIPHPLMHLRTFVLAPLAEIAPGLRHPLLHETIAGLLARLSSGQD